MAAIESSVPKLVGKLWSWVHLISILVVAIESFCKFVGKLRSWVRLISILVPERAGETGDGEGAGDGG